MKPLIAFPKGFPSDLTYALLLFIVTRIVLTIIGVTSRILLEPFHGEHYVWVYSHRLWLDIWGVWDTGWYLNIAANWYSPHGDLSGQSNFAFFPLYPLLMRGFGAVTGNNYVAGLFVSNVALLGASLLLFRLVRLDADEETARRSVKYLFLSPVGFILSGAFTESLYLFLILACFHSALRGRWMLSGFAGLLLTLTKGMGVFIVLPLAFEYLRAAGFRLGRLRADVLFLFLPPSALLLFSGYLFCLTGDWLAWAHAHAAGWQAGLSNPLANLSRGLLRTKDLIFLFPSWVALIACCLLGIFWRRVRFSYVIFGIYSMLISLSFGKDVIFSSLLRHLLPVFPLCLILANLGEDKRVDELCSVSLALLQGFLMVFWCNGFKLII